MASKTSGRVNPVPKGFHTVTPVLIIRGAADAIEFYKHAFDAKEHSRALAQDGVSIAQAELQIGNSRILVCDEYPEIGITSPVTVNGSTVIVHLYVKDVDTLWRQALDSGARVLIPLEDTYWGDRYGKLIDPFGHQWSLASRRRNLSEEEIAERAKALFNAEQSPDE